MAKNTDEAVARRLGRFSSKNEPNWITGDLGNYTSDAYQLRPGDEAHVQARHLAPSLYIESGIMEPKIEEKQQGPVQQSDLLKPVLMDIAKKGLNFAYQKCTGKPNPHEYSMTKKPKRVIVVGAGMAGLVAAYELEQVGHDVIVLESQTRVGGRIHTLGEKDGFAKNLHAEAGAMRLPCEPDVENKTHFLTDFYASERFKLTLAHFSNYSEDTYLKFYNEKAVRRKEWDDATFDKLWPGWNDTLKENGVEDIKSINDYYDCTTKVVTDQLLHLLNSREVKSWKAWAEWIDIWSYFSLHGFLRSSYEAVVTKFKTKSNKISVNSLEDLKKYLPWPDAAITAYSVFTYTEQLDQSLVQYLRDQLGKWFTSDMHCIQGGMSLLPDAFTEPNKGGWNPEVHLYQKIEFNRTVREIIYTFQLEEPEKNHVMVKGYFSNSRQPFQVEADAIIVATPINILRQIKYTPSDTATQSPPQSFHKAIEGIFTGPATKLFIQTKTRFWEKEGIKGGFSKTNLPIGQLHYPTNLKGEHPGEKGILLVYTWKTEAQLFGSLDPTTALHEAVEQIATIHPQIKQQVETGAVCAWYNQSTAQGAYALLKPAQYQNVRYLLEYPMANIFFAGDGLSFAAGWIQGALESGLRAAFQFYIRNEGQWSKEDKRSRKTSA